MRAATVIVGAIAASSILIALAFILSDGDTSEQAGRTKTVTEFQEAAPDTGAATAGGPQPCGAGEVTVENVSCAIGEEIHSQYQEGGRGELVAIDEDIGETVIMSCEVSAPVVCTGPGGATVYFAP
jgi:hypothetical protein